jgi:hypothetical protein
MRREAPGRCWIVNTAGQSAEKFARTENRCLSGSDRFVVVLVLPGTRKRSWSKAAVDQHESDVLLVGLQTNIIVSEVAMKRVRLLCFVLGLLAVSAGFAFAGEEELIALSMDRNATVQRLLAQMHQCSLEEMRGLACILGEGKVTEAVIPLMNMLHNGSEDCRIAAALALSRIGDARGEFAVKQAARLDDSPRVRLLAAWFYETYVQSGSFAFVREDKTSPAFAVEK